MNWELWLAFAAGILIGGLFGFRKGHMAGQNFAARMLDEQVMQPLQKMNGK